MGNKKYCILESTLTNIADAIRAKTGDTAKIDPDDMPDAIMGIVSGGGTGGGSSGGTGGDYPPAAGLYF